MEKLIKDVAARALGVSPDSVSISHRLMGGMSNQMYVIAVGEALYTFRIPGKQADVFVDRSEEIANIGIVEGLELNNETFYFDTETGYKIAKYVKGTPIGELENQEGQLGAIATLLKRLHQSGLQAHGDYNPYGRLAKYEQLVGSKTPLYERLKAEFLGYRSLLDQQEQVICHNDSQLSNMVVGTDQVYLLDWEFAGKNDPLYDVACVGNQDFSLAEKCLPIYLGRKPTQAEWTRLYAWRAFQCLQWHNVALYKEQIGLSADLGVDFAKVAAGYLEKAEGFLKQAKHAALPTSTSSSRSNFKTLDLVQTALFAALVFLATSSIRVPVMPGAGLIHTGTVILFIVAVCFGPVKGALAGSSGMALFNLTTEWAVWAPYTFVIRLVMGYLIGWVAHVRGAQGRSWKLNLTALLVSAVWFLPTTYVAQIVIQGVDWRVPMAAIPGNLAQLGLALAFGLPAIPRIIKVRDKVLGSQSYVRMKPSKSK